MGSVIAATVVVAGYLGRSHDQPLATIREVAAFA
jgi:hypothetical protein